MQELKTYNKKSKTRNGKAKVDQELLKGAKKSALPREVKPMLATLVDKPFNNENWIFEIKYDGYRALAEVDGQKVRLYSRNNKTFTAYPAINEALKKLPFKALLDGEIAIVNEKGRSNFQAMQNRDESVGNLIFYVFDLLHYDGYDLRDLPLLKRKEILKKALPDSEILKYSDHVQESGVNFFKASSKLGLEGVIAKRADSIYETSARSKSWLKIKMTKEQEAIICGYTEPKGSRSSIGALLLGVYEKNKLKYIGKTGTGFKEKDLKYIKQLLKPLEVETAPDKAFAPDKKNVQWVKPKIICHVKFSELTNEGIMRHPSFIGLREDKETKEVHQEKPLPVKKALSKTKVEKVAAAKKTTKENFEKVTITNPKKIFWPNEGYKKIDVVNYYKEISPIILPYLKDRPQSLYRTPDGVVKKGFFQKNVAGKVPDWIETIVLYSESTGENIEYMLCQDEDTLLYMANMGCIEINPWSSTTKHLDNPDWAVFDLDPLEISFEKVTAVAQAIRKVLDHIEVEGFCKTSGSKGIHIYVPLGGQYTYDQSQQFIKLIEMKIHKRLLSITSLERMPAKRKKKVYLDFLQNAKGKTMASVYSLRPKPGAPVSAPVTWDEVNKKLDPLKFNINTLPKRIDKVGDLWKDFLSKKTDMMSALQKLEQL